jgi:hypothetical protein
MITLIQKQREMFDKEIEPQITKYGQNPLLRTTKISKTIKSFLNTCLIEHYEEDIREFEEMKWEKDTVCTHYQDNCSCRSDKEVRNHNTALDLAISLLQDKIKQLKQ